MLEMVSSDESPNLGTLSPSCLQLIVSHLDYHSVSKLRQVCKSLDVVGKKVLNQGYQGLKNKLVWEFEKAQKHGLVPSLQKTSFRKFHFLSNTYDVLRHCGKTYSYFFGDDNSYFVAGKVLDVTYRLWDYFNSCATLPFVKDSILVQTPHPLLGPLIEVAKKAYSHFQNIIVPKFIITDEDFPYDIFKNVLHLCKKLARISRPSSDLMIINFIKQDHRRKFAKELKKRFEENDKMISIGKQMNRQFLNEILRLNEAVKDLIQETAQMDVKLANFMDQSMTFLFKSNCLLESSSSLISNQKKSKASSRSSSVISDGERPNLGTLPSSCLQHIFLNLSYEKVSQLRRVCKNFDESSKKVLNKGFAMLKAEVVNGYHQEDNAKRIYYCPSVYVDVREIDENLVADLRILILYCEDTYKWYLDGKFYFSAGKVLDEIRKVIECYRFTTDIEDDDIDVDEKRPSPNLFPLMDLIHRAIKHFRDKFVPKYYPRKCSPRHTPEYVSSDRVPAMNFCVDKRNILYIEKMEKNVKEQEKEIKKRNEKNRKFVKVISQLKKSSELLNSAVSDKKKLLSELEQKWLTLFPVKRNRNCTRICKRKWSSELEQQWLTITPVKRNRKCAELCKGLNKT